MRQRPNDHRLSPDAEERLTGGRVRGSLLRAHIGWVETYGNAVDNEMLWIELSRNPGARLGNGFADADWMPLSALIVVDRFVASRFAFLGDENQLMEDIGRHSARALFATRFRQWTDVDHHLFFTELAEATRDIIDFANWSYRPTGPKQGYLAHQAASCFSRLLCSSTLGFYDQCLIARGALRPSVSEETCKCLGWPMCKFLLRWR